jgi:pimeloyl-[acyl-carrier protein] methyl ester esterase
MARLEVEGSKSIYYEHYRGTGPAVVLVHGWGMSCRVWDINLSVLLDAGHEVVSLDHRCCGSSDKDFDAMSTATVAADVVKLIEATGVDQPIVVGWSFGAAVVAEVAIKMGSKLRGIVLVGPPTPRYTQADGYPHGGTVEVVEQTVAALKAARPTFLHGLSGGVCHADVGAPTIEWMWQIFMQASPRADDGLADLATLDHRDQLPSVTVPALICSGDHDAIVDPAIAGAAAELLPNSQLLRFSDSGHAPFVEEPEKFNAALLAFAADPQGAALASVS